MVLPVNIQWLNMIMMKYLTAAVLTQGSVAAKQPDVSPVMLYVLQVTPTIPHLVEK